MCVKYVSFQEVLKIILINLHSWM